MKWFAVSTLICTFSLTLLSLPANAQATRTWVSGAGNDGNPCSRSAPCLTFAGAISKTAAGGEINCIDAGGFGMVTITFALTISCQAGTAGVLATSSSNGIVVAAGASDSVFLQGLNIEGAGSGLNGISFTSGKFLHVTDTVIGGFTGSGINFVPGVTAALFAQNTTISGNSGDGIVVAPTGGTTAAAATLTNVQLVNNAHGLTVKDNANATVFNSAASSNRLSGFFADGTSVVAQIDLFHSVASYNGTNGLAAGGTAGIIRYADTAIFGNVTGVNPGSGTIASFTPATNPNVDNATNGTPNGSSVALQ
jgi:Right handed beta helix region